MKKRFEKQVATQTKTIYVVENCPGNYTTYINWPLIPLMQHYGPETLEAAKITARNDVTYLSRRKGEIPFEVQRLINSPHDSIF